ncbi:unnamed protein product, partial [Symbiodinium sp. KB8]
MWLLRCSETFELLAVLSIYVDDLLLSGTTEASEAIWTAIKAKWRISEPEYADLGKSVTFCGFEIQQKSDGLHVGQSKYIQSLLDKYPEIQGTTTCPYAKENEIIETKPNASLEKLRTDRSQSGIIMLWGNAELQASLDGMTLAEGLYGLLEELAEATQKAFLYNDNVGACTVL